MTYSSVVHYQHRKKRGPYCREFPPSNYRTTPYYAAVTCKGCLRKLLVSGRVSPKEFKTKVVP